MKLFMITVLMDFKKKYLKYKKKYLTLNKHIIKGGSDEIQISLEK